MKKLKLLVVSDDIRMPSGVGIQANKLLRGLNRTGKYEIVEIAGSLLPQAPNPVLYEGIKLFPTSDGYGNPNMLRAIVSQEKPDVVLCFSDPRFFQYLFMMDNELRSKAKVVFYHTWDNAPFPKYNLPWYSACDEIVMISRFSYELLSANGITATHIPHGIDPSEFYPLPDDIVNQERQHIINQSGKKDVKFIAFWNNRNITRKRPGDVIAIFNAFHKRHPDALLFMNTGAIDRDGTDLISIQQDLGTEAGAVMFNFQRIPTDKLNLLYNVADVTLNISYNEGFGLCVAESLAAGTPVIATRTGGIPEQMCNIIEHPEVIPEGPDAKGCQAHTEEVQFGECMPSIVTEMFGVPGMPYINRDFVSYDQVDNALERAYQSTVKQDGAWKQKGEEGRDFIIQNFHIDRTVKQWDELLHRVHATPSSFRQWRHSIL